MSRKTKMAAVLLMTGGLVLGAATAALAHSVAIKIHCTEIRLTFTFFPETGTNTATVTFDGEVETVTWTGEEHEVTLPISGVQNGDVVTVSVDWESSADGLSGTTTSSSTVMDCPPGPSPSPSPSPSQSPSPSPSPSPTSTPTPAATTPPPTTPPPAAPGGGGAQVQPQTVQPGPGGQAAGEAAGQAQAQGQVAGALAFTGPTPALPLMASLAALSFLTGLAALMWGARYRGIHRA